jgi:molybdate-binding protein/DNA-binding transcriptional regulator YhcF (GntR family)
MQTEPKATEIYFYGLICYTCLIIGELESPYMEIKLDYHSSVPLYQQIAEQLRQLIAMEQIKPGERLPSIRQLSHTLSVNPNTVCRAFLELEQEQILISRRGGGTSVSPDRAAGVRSVRQKRLLENTNEDIIRSLSQGYSPEELEAAFYLSLERWREERKFSAKGPGETAAPGPPSNIIRIVGSHDVALNILLDMVRQRVEGFRTEVIHAGSLGGLIALQEERADLAGTHLLDEETGEYNFPYVKRVLPGRELAVVNLSYRIQGLMFARGNPRKITGLADLLRPDVTFVNRQKGSGTRVLLDLQLKRQGISPSEIKGYEVEFDSHLAVASYIARGSADVGLGIEAAATSHNLGFMAMFRERYDLVIPLANYRSERLAPMLEIIASEEFKKIVDGVGGYDTSQTGSTVFVK